MTNFPWSTAIRAGAVGVLAVAVLTLEWVGKAPAGTFVNQIAMPLLVGLGVHASAKALT